MLKWMGYPRQAMQAISINQAVLLVMWTLCTHYLRVAVDMRFLPDLQFTSQTLYGQRYRHPLTGVTKNKINKIKIKSQVARIK